MGLQSLRYAAMVLTMAFDYWSAPHASKHKMHHALSKLTASLTLARYNEYAFRALAR